MTLSDKLKKLRYEDGKRLPKRNPENYNKLAALYEVSADYLKDDSQGDDPKMSVQQKKRTPRKRKESSVAAEIQYGESSISLDLVMAKAREIGATNIYIKPEENAVYYVAGDDSGKFELF